MSEEAGKDPKGDPEGSDTDEVFQDHPELAPNESRISIEKVKGLEEESRKRSLAGDPVEDAGDRHHKTELYFVRNQDFAGNEISLSTDADYSRGSGFIGGKLVGEGPSGEPNPVGTRPEGFDPSINQDRDREAALEGATPPPADWTARPTEPGSEADQGRGIPRPQQATGEQGYGRDMGASGLSQEDRETHTISPGAAAAQTPEHKTWAAILRRLGGGSPGSEENLQLAELFSKVQFPADREEVFRRIAPNAEFRIREGIVVDLHQAVEHSRTRNFRNLGDLVDCVKDELRRQEAEGKKLLKSV